MTRLLSDIVALTPSAYESLRRCARLFYCRELLRIPDSDPGPSNDTGLLVHDMLWRIHTTGSCHDHDHVIDVLASHGADSEHVRDLVGRHALRCPSASVERAAHEQELARFHHLPVPMFMASARLDAIWVHDGLLDVRDYKTGRPWHERVRDAPGAMVQAFVLAPAARSRDLRLRLRYEYLVAEVDDDPEPWEPDDDDLAAVEEELRVAVAHMWENDDWVGVRDAAICGTCRYRSICRDSATPGEPSWPVLTAGTDGVTH